MILVMFVSFPLIKNMKLKNSDMTKLKYRVYINGYAQKPSEGENIKNHESAKEKPDRRNPKAIRRVAVSWLYCFYESYAKICQGDVTCKFV